MLSALLLAASLHADVDAIAALPGEPHAVSAAGLTAADAPILTLENAAAFDPSAVARRLVIVGGFGGDERATTSVLAIVRWFKRESPSNVRTRWAVSALPAAAFEAADRASLERWITFQAPDVLLEVRTDGRTEIAGLRSEVASPDDAVAAAKRIVTGAAAPRSALHETLVARVSRTPLDVARLLAPRYPQTPSISYIPSVAWVNALQLSSITGDPSFANRVREQTAPWTSGEKSQKTMFGDRIQLTSVAGAMVFADLAAAPGDKDPWPLALEAARLAAARNDRGIAAYGQGWTDDMFMAGVILARVGARPDQRQALDSAAKLLIDYASRLQRPDGVFMHATDGPFAWGRGNGFAALGLTEVLMALPENHPDRAAILDIYRRHMTAVVTHQAPDGMWREVIDEPGAYREETATAMLMTAISRGLRRGWLAASFRPAVDRAWRGLSAHVAADATLIDVCTGTGSGPTRRYYLERQAIVGPDDRGGAMALMAAMEMNELMRSNDRKR